MGNRIKMAGERNKKRCLICHTTTLTETACGQYCPLCVGDRHDSLAERHYRRENYTCRNERFI